jgi:glycosyltransferase involved in cell wall biosynthesis
VEANPRVSVIVVSRNSAATIGNTIRSLRNQTMDRWEALIVDSGSEDATVEIAHSFNDPRIRVFNIPPCNVGVSRNHGIRYARAPFVSILDSDDVWPRWTLATQLEAFSREPEMDAVYGDCRLVSKDESIGFERSHVVAYPSVIGLRDIIIARPLCAVTMSFKAEALARIGGYDPALANIEDYDLYYRLVVSGARIMHIPRILATVTVRPNGLSGDIEGYRHWMAAVLTKLLRNDSLKEDIRQLILRELSGLDSAAIPRHEVAMREVVA